MDEYTVSEAARRLGMSEPTVRRKVGNVLEQAGSGPLRLTRDSVDRVRADILWGMGVHNPSEPQPVADLQGEIERLAAENESLRNVIQRLRLANDALNDAIGQMTAPTIPNS